MERTPGKYTLGDYGDFIQRPLLIPQVVELVEEASSWPDEIKNLFVGATSTSEGDVAKSGSMLEAFKQLLMGNQLINAFVIVLLPVDANGKVTPHSKKDRVVIEEAILDGCDLSTGLGIITDFFTFNASSVKDFLEQANANGLQIQKNPTAN